MAERDLPWYLFGAQAAIIWGSPRLSADVDVTATIDPKAIDSFVETMRQYGFHLLVADSDFLARTRVLPLSIAARVCRGIDHVGLVAHAAAGVTVRNGSAAVTTGDAFHIGSCTNPFTAMIRACSSKKRTPLGHEDRRRLSGVEADQRERRTLPIT
jgi:hypothetical protein